MDAKSIWNTTITRTNYSSTHKLMKKPNRKDFPNNRNGRSRYQNALRKYNASVRKTNQESEKKKKNIGKDPRPKIGDYKNREAYRQAVLKWRKKNVTPQTKTIDSRGRKRNNSLKIKKQVDKYVADRKVPINKVNPEVKPEVKKETKYKPRADAKVIKDKQNKGKTPSYKPRAEAKVIKDKQVLKAKPKKMHAIEKRNRKRFGDAHVDKLKAQYKAFKEKRKKKKS